MRAHLPLAAVCVTMTCSMASAQSVAVIRKTVGTVLVNHGNGFVTAPPGTPLASGDTVSVRRGGRVVVEYENGCTETLEPGRARTVDPAQCVKDRHGTVDGAGSPLLGGLFIAGGGIGAAIALSMTQGDGAPGGGDHNQNPVSR